MTLFRWWQKIKWQNEAFRFWGRRKKWLILQEEPEEVEERDKANLSKPEAPATSYTDPLQRHRRQLQTSSTLGELKDKRPKYLAMYFRVIIWSPHMILFWKALDTFKLKFWLSPVPQVHSCTRAQSQVPKRLQRTCYFLWTNWQEYADAHSWEYDFSTVQLYATTKDELLAWWFQYCRAFMRIFDSCQSRTCLQDKDYEPYRATSTPQEPDPVSRTIYHT